MLKSNAQALGTEYISELVEAGSEGMKLGRREESACCPSDLLGPRAWDRGRPGGARFGFGCNTLFLYSYGIDDILTFFVRERKG